MELGDAFTYGPDYTDRIVELTSNPFWSNWRSNCILNKDVILESPLWHNPLFRLQNRRREWRESGIMVISDLIDYLEVPLKLETINSTNNIKMNFLEYVHLTFLINTHLDWMDIPEFCVPRPENSLLNILLSIDTKGASNLYRALHPKCNQL